MNGGNRVCMDGVCVNICDTDIVGGADDGLEARRMVSNPGRARCLVQRQITGTEVIQAGVGRHDRCVIDVVLLATLVVSFGLPVSYPRDRSARTVPAHNEPDRKGKNHQYHCPSQSKSGDDLGAEVVLGCFGDVGGSAMEAGGGRKGIMTNSLKPRDVKTGITSWRSTAETGWAACHGQRDHG